MSPLRKDAPRGASAVPIVILSVLFLLGGMCAWMWYDMTKNDLEGKAKRFAELKKQNGGAEQPASNGYAASTVNSAPQMDVFECRRADGPIAIDGSPGDTAWREAQVIENFAQPWLGPNHPAKSKTSARLLWDDQFLYFVAEMDDFDVFADITQHNGNLWDNDVFELFFKPSPGSPAYYEFEINAKNATLEMFLPSRGSGGMRRWANAFPFHLETKVAMRGNSTLNNHTDRDVGWVVEGRIPWTDFSHTGGKPKPGDEWKFALCRFDFSVQNEEPELSTCAPLKQPSFHQYEDYAVLKFK